MADGKIVIETGLDTSGIKDGISKIESIAGSGLKATTAAIGAVSTALMGAGGYAVKVGSDFEAAMSKVEAISGATAEQMDALAQKAKDMGASTKFSATESAEAFQYMAMAGWDSAKMIDGIDGIMNLAAADGLDLATTSDIVTDALTAFGLAASDSTHFADVLATASSNANTNVAMLGESFKYVAPVAGAMNYSVEDVSKALGLMANASVKGSMAGTTLKTSLARMAAPTDKMAKAMEQYSISLTDSEGNMKSLDEVMKNLRKSLGGLSEDEQTAAASTIFGKEAMAGMLAIINASEQDYNKLSNAIANADGTAQRMADTMNDNLQGKVTLAKSALEGLGIQIYETMEDGLKEAVETGTGYIDRLADAFTDGGLEGAVNEAGDVIADLATDIAESAPDMIAASTKLINSFVKGIVKNKKQIKKAGKEIVNSLVDGLKGLSEVLPKELQGPIKKAIDTICTMFKNVGSSASNIAKTSIPALTKAIGFLADNLDILLPVLTGTLAAMKGFSVVNGVTSAVNTLRSSTSSLFSLISANPIGLAASAILGVTGALVTYNLTMDESEKKFYRLSDAQQKNIDTLREWSESYDEARQARAEDVAAIESEYGNYEKLKEELQSITDENGNVKDGYEKRAEVITTTLSQAFGIEVELMDGQIQKMGEVCKSIDEVIKKKKAEAMLSALQEDMASSYERITEATSVYQDAVTKTAEAEEAHRIAAKEYVELQLADHAAEAAGNYGMYAEELRQAEEALNDTRDALSEQTQTMQEAEINMNSLAQETANYNNLQKAVAEGDLTAMEEAMSRLTSEYQMFSAEMLATNDSAREALKKQAEDTVATLQTFQQEGGVMYEAFGDKAADELAKTVDNFNNFSGGILEGIRELGPEASGAMTGALATADFSGKLDNEGKESLRSLLQAYDELSPGLQEQFAHGVEGAMQGLEGFDQVQEKAREEGLSFIEALAEVLEVHSPSRAVKEIFSYVAPGAVEGLSENESSILEKGRGVVSGFVGALTSGLTESNLPGIFGNSTQQAVDAASQSLIGGSATLMAAGGYAAVSVGQQYAASMKQGEASVVSATKSVTNAAGTTLRNSNLGVDSTKQGTQITQGLNIGIKNGAPLVKFAVLSLGNQTKESLKNSKLQNSGMQEGNKLSSGTASGIRSGAPQATSAASSMGNSAKNALENVGLHGGGVSVGLNFARGFENGIRSGASGAINAAASMARQSLQAAKNELDIHSPSRKTEYVGKMYSAGAEKGIEKNQNAPISAAKEMAKNMIGAMDVSAAFSGMRAAMNYNVGRFASRVLVSGQITGEANNSNNISDKELKAIGEAVAEVVNDRMEEFKFVFRDRELGRAVREVQTT